MARIHRTILKKDINDPDNHDGVITHSEPDILECEVKWALASVTTNKGSGGDGIPAELFDILKDDAVMMLILKDEGTQYTRKSGKLSSGHKTGKGQFSFQSQRRAMPKNVQTTAQLLFLLAVLIPACASSSLAFHMMYSAYKLNMLGDNIQP